MPLTAAGSGRFPGSMKGRASAKRNAPAEYRRGDREEDTRQPAKFFRPVSGAAAGAFQGIGGNAKRLIG